MPTRSRILRAGLPLIGLVALLVVLGLAPPTTDLPPQHAGRPDAPPTLNPAGLVGPEPEPGKVLAMSGIADDGSVVVVRGRGWGHSVGMSQYGAQAQALAGRGYRDILGHYYPGTSVVGHAAADTDIRVGLFRNRDVRDPDRLRLATAGRGGGAPDRPVEVRVGDEAVPVPHGEVWALVAGGGELALVDADGEVRAAGEPPVSVSYGFLEGTPTLLRLPQLARPEAPLSGTLQWGLVEVDVVDDEVRPTLVIPLDLYLRGLAEMPSTWEAEALRAQAVAGRTYAVRMALDGVKDDCGCHLGATPHDQAYAGWLKEGGRAGDRWRDAVEATAGEVVTYEGDPAWTYYSSSHGGRSEAASDSWAYDEDQAAPYLVSVEDPWSLADAVANPMASWEREIPAGAFARALGLAELRHVAVTARTQGGSPAALSVTGTDLAGNAAAYEFRGWRTGIAGSDLKLRFRAELPSQQVTSIELRPPPPDPAQPAAERD